MWQYRHTVYIKFGGISLTNKKVILCRISIPVLAGNKSNSNNFLIYEWKPTKFDIKAYISAPYKCCFTIFFVLYTVFCTCTYHEQWEGVTRSFTVSCTYTTMNKEAVSQDFYCMQPWKKGCVTRYFTVSCTCVYYVYVDNYCNITCWLLFQLKSASKCVLFRRWREILQNSTNLLDGVGNIKKRRLKSASKCVLFRRWREILKNSTNLLDGVGNIKKRRLKSASKCVLFRRWREIL